MLLIVTILNNLSFFQSFVIGINPLPAFHWIVWKCASSFQPVAVLSKFWSLRKFDIAGVIVLIQLHVLGLFVVSLFEVIVSRCWINDRLRRSESLERWFEAAFALCWRFCQGIVDLHPSACWSWLFDLALTVIYGKISGWFCVDLMVFYLWFIIVVECDFRSRSFNLWLLWDL